MQRAAVYIRLSEDRRETGDNVADQEKAARKIAEDKGAEVVRVYNDNDFVASDPKRKPRPGFEQMLTEGAQGAFDLLVIRHVDRLYRTPYDQQRISDAFGPRGIVIHQEWTGHPLDLSTPTGILNAGIMAQVAQYETNHKKQRQRAMNQARALDGLPPEGGPVPYGYQDDRLTLAPEADVVREMARRVLDGEPLGAIARDLNSRGITTPRGSQWRLSTLRGVLLRPLNAGLVFYDGAILRGVSGRWQPILEEETYYAVKAVLEDPARLSPGDRKRRHLLAGLVRCGSCLTLMKSGRVNADHRIYRCSTSGCPQPVHVAMEPLHAEIVERFLAERGDRLRVVQEIREDVGALRKAVQTKIRSITARLADPDADAEALFADLQAAKAEERQLDGSTTRTVLVGSRASLEWSRARDVEEQRKILQGHLRVLAIAPRGSVTHRFDATRVEINWIEDPVTLPDGTALGERLEDVPEGEGVVGPIIVTL